MADAHFDLIVAYAAWTLQEVRIEHLKTILAQPEDGFLEVRSGRRQVIRRGVTR